MFAELVLGERTSGRGLHIPGGAGLEQKVFIECPLVRYSGDQDAVVVTLGHVEGFHSAAEFL